MSKLWKYALVACSFAIAAQSQPAGPSGDWNGSIAGRLRIVLHLDKAPDGTVTGVLQSPDQGNFKTNAADLSIDSQNHISFSMKQIASRYAGKFNGAEIDGIFEQNGARIPLILRRTDAPAPPKSIERGRVHMDACTESGIDAYCGTYQVWENRETKAGRKISLNLMILPSFAEKPLPDPVFAFAGGPGESATAAFPLATFAHALRATRDIVLIDQRGSGKSNPLTCPVDPNDVQTLVAGAYNAGAMATCRPELEKHADLTQYTTSIAADDEDEVRSALGYDKVNVIGGSYGTLAAQVYLRRHGEHVRTMVIEGVAPPDYRMPLPFAKTIQAALDRLFADCAADPSCHAAYPDLKTEFEAVVKRLDTEPAKFEFKTGSTTRPITLSRGQFVSALRPLLYVPTIVSRLPDTIHRAYGNDWQQFASYAITIHRAIAQGVARGLAFSVSCAESMPFITEADVTRETGGTWLGDHDIQTYEQGCRGWPTASVPKSYLAPVRANVPVLLISGVEDPATPPRFAEHAAEQLAHSRVVSIPHGTHGTSSACIDTMMADFVQHADTAAINVACVNDIRNPPFYAPKAAK